MNFKKNILVLFVTCLCCLLGSGNLFAQDVITKKDGKKLKVVIKEISDTEIKYVDYRDVEGVVFVMDRALIREIKFSYGEKIKEEGPNQDANYYVDDRNQNIKINFTAIAANATILTYERAIDPSSSLEYSLRIPGFGINENNGTDLSGIGFSVGYKLKIGSVFKKEGYRPKHIMEGSYFRLLAGYLYTRQVMNRSNSEETNSNGQIGIEYGKQWIASNRAAFDLYVGFHYFGGSSRTQSNNGGTFDDFIDDELIGGDIYGANNVAFSFGFRIGGLFGNYGNAVKIKKKKKRRK
jgi:hypothetical protein